MLCPNTKFLTPSERQQRLEAAIDRALADRGTIMIPAFSLGRTQKLLYELEDILYRKALLTPRLEKAGDDPLDWSQLPIILDSPLAQRITRAYQDRISSGMPKLVSACRKGVTP